MSLNALLNREADLVDEFVACLVHEREVLSQDKIQNLQQVTDRKNQLISDLTRVATERAQILRQDGFPDSAEGLKAWLTVNASVQTQAIYERLKSGSAEAKRLNELNAHQVTIRLQATQQALSILLPPEQSPSLYNPHGQSSLKAGFKLIDSA